MKLLDTNLHGSIYEDKLLQNFMDNPNDPTALKAILKRAEKAEINRRIIRATERVIKAADKPTRFGGSLGLKIAALENSISETDARRKSSGSTKNIARYDALLKALRIELCRLTEDRIKILKGTK